MLGHGLHESRREPPSFRVRSASLRGDRKPRRNRQAEAGHLSQSCSLATEEIPHLPPPLEKAIDQFTPTHHWMRPFTRSSQAVRPVTERPRSPTTSPQFCCAIC